MKINNSTRKQTVDTMVGQIRAKNYDEVFLRLGYLTGLYAGFYIAAVLDKLTAQEKESFLQAFSTKCDK